MWNHSSCRAKVFFVGHSLSRYNTELTFNVDDQALVELAKSILAEDPTKAGCRRKFFGIAQSRVSQEGLSQYKKVCLQGH